MLLLSVKPVTRCGSEAPCSALIERKDYPPFDFGSDATVGLATVLQIAGELVGGAIALLEDDNRYAAAALIRQLVEVEYLAWAFAEDEEEAKKWMRSSKDERQQFWKPGHIRDRANGRFRGIDYSEHCGKGPSVAKGHLTPPLPPQPACVGLILVV